MTKPDFIAGMKVAANYDVSSNPDTAVIYSISFQPDVSNREKAFAYAQKHPEKMLIEHTDCGAKLVEMGFESTASLNQEEAMTVWSEASRRFITAAAGNITAFVDGADPRSIFRKVELPNILQNDKIKTVNHMDKFLFAAQFDRRRTKNG